MAVAILFRYLATGLAGSDSAASMTGLPLHKFVEPLVTTALAVNVKAVLPEFGYDAVHSANVGLFDDVQGSELPTLRQQIENAPEAFTLFNAGGVHD
jgi:hypothetical protein